MNVWTVGHSTHSTDAFLALLAAHEISQVADVRAVPRSRRHPHFDAAALTVALPARGVSYVRVAQLGGWRRAGADSPNRAWSNVSFRGYADYAMGEEFAAGLARLRRLAATRRTAVMCAEALWWRCHRRLVADRLVVAGDTVHHVSSTGGVAAHRLAPFAKVEPGGQIVYPAPAQAGPQARTA